MTPNKILETARSAARAGGEVLTRYFRQDVEVSSKEPSNLVSRADLESEQTIVEVIRNSFPKHEFLGEESHHGDITAEHLWIIDPLDGTNNFLHGLRHFAVSIAYYRAGEAVCGVVYNPSRDDWFEAVRGEGATANGQPAQVGPQSSLDDVFVGAGFYYDRGAMMEATLATIRSLFQQNIHGIRRFGTASIDLVYVGMGSFGAFFEYELAPWDFAAGRLFVEEAGGSVTTCLGGPLPLAKTSVLASNRHLHAAMLEITQRHLPS